MTKTLLLVEDDPFTVELVRRALDRAGVRADVVVERSGEEALSRLRSLVRAGDAPDAVLLDLRPLGSGGLDLVGEVRSLSDGRPVVVYTGTASEEDEARARAAGAADFFVKPDEFDDLVARMRDVGRWLQA